MAYEYGESAVHRLPIPRDETPLDQVSWEHLVERLHIGVPQVCGSQAEQEEYLRAVQEAGLGPSLQRIVRVTRTDLHGLTMRNDGTGWVREYGGLLKTAYFLETAGATGPNVSRGIAGASVTLPCKAIVVVHGHVIYEPPASGWAFLLNVRDDSGQVASPEIRYSYAIKHTPAATAQISVPLEVPAGTTKLNLWVKMESQSQGVTFRNAGIAVHYGG